MTSLRIFLRTLAKRFPVVKRLYGLYLQLRGWGMRLLGRLQPIDSRLIIFEAYNGRAYACSPKAIYQQMLKDNRFADYQFVWAFRRPQDYQFLLDNPRTSLIGYRSWGYYMAYARAKYWVVNTMIPLDVVKRSSQVMLQCWHGTPLKRLRNDIVASTQNAMNSLADFIRKNKADTARYDYFISPSAFATEKFTTAFDLVELGKQDIVIETGYPRNDFLFSHTDDDAQRIKSELSLPADKKILLYCPTWRDDQHTAKDGYVYQSPVDFDLLQSKLSNDYVILFRAHYLVANAFDFAKYQGFIYNVSEVDDVNDLYVIADVLMTDYSSVFFDYANLGRPIVFFMYDLEHYQKELRGFYLQLDELPGDILQTEDEIVATLGDLESYQTKNQAKYQAFGQKFNYLDDARSAERVVARVWQDQLAEWRDRAINSGTEKAR